MLPSNRSLAAVATPTAAWHTKAQSCRTPPSTGVLNCPGLGPPCRCKHGLLPVDHKRLLLKRFPNWTRGEREGAAARSGGPLHLLVLLFSCFLTAALTRQSFFDALLLTGLQVKGVALDLLNDVFLLHFSLEAAQSILERFALLEPDFCQLDHTPKLVPFGRLYLCQGSSGKSSASVKICKPSPPHEHCSCRTVGTTIASITQLQR